MEVVNPQSPPTTPTPIVTDPAPAPATPPVAPAPTPPATPPAAPAFENGGHIQSPKWFNSVDWMQVGLIFLGSITMFTLIRYYNVKTKNLKTEIPDIKGKVTELEDQVNTLDQKKADKSPGRQQPKILGL